jgi:hypothetical protein
VAFSRSAAASISSGIIPFFIGFMIREEILAIDIDLIMRI